MAKQSSRRGRTKAKAGKVKARKGRTTKVKKPRKRQPAAGAARQREQAAAWEKPRRKARQQSRSAAQAISPYLRPVVSPAPPPMLAAGAGPGGVAVRGIEVTQAIQSVDNTVLLLADKPTMVRVYLDPSGFSGATTVTGELTWQRGGGGAHYLPAINRLTFGPVQQPSLTDQRFDLQKSLNFLLPDEAITEGSLELRLNRLLVPGGAQIPFDALPATQLRFRFAPPLRVRVIGLRYRSNTSPNSHVTPSSIHFAYLKSYLERAYPVSAVEWSQIVVDGDQLTPPFGSNTSNVVNAQLAALRAREISTGTDPRTHYFGLVDTENGSNFMRGSAMYNQVTKIFGMVACGPCGVPEGGWTGDTDASFADWYGAHELGHTFQRRHPGFPTDKQPRDPDEPGFPYAHGFISGPDNKFVGFDMGDETLGLPMLVLPGNIHHDVMTYADSQWLSAYTYEAVHARLVVEDQQLAPVV